MKEEESIDVLVEVNIYEVHSERRKGMILLGVALITMLTPFTDTVRFSAACCFSAAQVLLHI